MYIFLNFLQVEYACYILAIQIDTLLTASKILTFSLGRVELADVRPLGFFETMRSVVFQLFVVLVIVVPRVVDVFVGKSISDFGQIFQICFQRHDVWVVVVPKIFLDVDRLICWVEELRQSSSVNDCVIAWCHHGRCGTKLGCVSACVREFGKKIINAEQR